MKDAEFKKEQEKKIIREMILLYYKKIHTENLCDECKDVLDYACNRIDKCPFMEEKTFCSNCKSPCYNAKMRQKIKTIMRFSSKRMLFHHPILVIKHLVLSIREKIKIRRKDDKEKID